MAVASKTKTATPSDHDATLVMAMVRKGLKNLCRVLPSRNLAGGLSTDGAGRTKPSQGVHPPLTRTVSPPNSGSSSRVPSWGSGRDQPHMSLTPIATDMKREQGGSEHPPRGAPLVVSRI